MADTSTSPAIGYMEKVEKQNTATLQPITKKCSKIRYYNS